MHRILAQLISEDELGGVPKVVLGQDSTTLKEGLQIVFGILAALSVLIIAIAALRIVISRGNAQDITKSRDAIIYAAVGLAVSMSALAIVTFVVESI